MNCEAVFHPCVRGEVEGVVTGQSAERVECEDLRRGVTVALRPVNKRRQAVAGAVECCSTPNL